MGTFPDVYPLNTFIYFKYLDNWHMNFYLYFWTRLPNVTDRPTAND